MIIKSEFPRLKINICCILINNRKKILNAGAPKPLSSKHTLKTLPGQFSFVKAAFSSGKNSSSGDTYGDDGRNPVEYALYLQDKIEFDDLVVNIGMRWDYFDPVWKTLNDGTDANINSPVKPINNFFDLDGDFEI